MSDLKEKNYISIGKITSSSGIRGEVRVSLYAADSDSLKAGAKIVAVGVKKQLDLEVEKMRHQGGRVVVKFKGIDDRNTSDELRDYELQIAEEDLAKLEPGEIYVKDLIGMSVYDRAGDASIGTVSDYIQNRAQALWEVETEAGKKVLIPDVDQFVKEIDREEAIVYMELIPGFLE